jgi:hypothetical protein
MLLNFTHPALISIEFFFLGIERQNNLRQSNRLVVFLVAGVTNILVLNYV